MLIDIIKLRLNDGGLIRLIMKWLKAGVMEEGEIKQNVIGTHQGGKIHQGQIFCSTDRYKY